MKMSECNHRRSTMNDCLYCPHCTDLYSIEYVEGLEEKVKELDNKLGMVIILSDDAKRILRDMDD